jgi:hypothetical protein
MKSIYYVFLFITELSLMLVDFHTQDVEQTQVNLIHNVP